MAVNKGKYAKIIREKMSISERAAQFKPFAALGGYDEIIRNTSFQPCDKEELSEEKIEVLNNTLSLLEKGQVVSVKYYDLDRYAKVTGAVTEVDKVLKRLKIVKKYIFFSDLYEIRQEKEN